MCAVVLVFKVIHNRIIQLSQWPSCVHLLLYVRYITFCLMCSALLFVWYFTTATFHWDYFHFIKTWWPTLHVMTTRYSISCPFCMTVKSVVNVVYFIIIGTRNSLAYGWHNKCVKFIAIILVIGKKFDYGLDCTTWSAIQELKMKINVFSNACLRLPLQLLQIACNCCSCTK